MSGIIDRGPGFVKAAKAGAPLFSPELPQDKFYDIITGILNS
jgi:hypothetical protein